MITDLTSVETLIASIERAINPIFTGKGINLARVDALWLVFAAVADSPSETWRRAMYSLAALRTLDVVDDLVFDDLMEKLPANATSTAYLRRRFRPLARRCEPT